MPYVGLTPMEFAGCMVLGFVGLCCVCLLIVAFGAYVIRRDLDEHRARRELCRAQDREERLAPIIVRSARRDTHVLRPPTRAARRGHR